MSYGHDDNEFDMAATEIRDRLRGVVDALRALSNLLGRSEHADIEHAIRETLEEGQAITADTILLGALVEMLYHVRKAKSGILNIEDVLKQVVVLFMGEANSLTIGGYTLQRRTYPGRSVDLEQWELAKRAQPGLIRVEAAWQKAKADYEAATKPYTPDYRPLYINHK